jgi:Fur family ferric uptake transcriptional regulator
MRQGTKTRTTRQRQLILKELRKVTSHPTADELYAMVRERMPHISLGTVYRNLELLAAGHEILKLESAGNTRRFDGNTRPHRHVRCVNCGCVADVPCPSDPDDPDVEGIKVDGFMITAARVEYDGLCLACAAAAAAAVKHQTLS